MEQTNPDQRLYRRVADTLLDRIARGEYTSRLPGRSALVDEFGVAARTVQRALHELTKQGAVYRVPGLGYHVRAGADPGRVSGASAGPDGQPGTGPGDERAWMRVAVTLLDRILNQDLKPYERVPSRTALCQEFGCSRSPVTHALTALERQGTIKRIPGIGYQVMDCALSLTDRKLGDGTE